MSDPLIISVSGLRGVFGRSLTPDVARRYATAFAAELPPGPIVIGRDGRASGPVLAEAITSALAALGRNVLDAGPAATPTVGVLVQSSGAAGGIQISASHNPSEYNGLKLFSRAGRVIPAADGQIVLERFQAGDAASPSASLPAATQQIADATSDHLRKVEAICDVSRIRSRRFRVLLDANHGAGAMLGRPLLQSLGCEAIIRGEQPDGQFDHPPEPTAENLDGLRPEISKLGID
ncbi:MAG TPA: phosphoglucosamine mutase, partial [Lacipirellulaceae bacterium]|nr:phosphoglucosamine mutase [Lacipirellulaceae bacterium]